MHFKRIFSFVICLVITVIVFGGSVNTLTVANAASISQLESDRLAAQQESNKLKKEIASLKAANAPYEEQKAALKKQIAATEKEIDLYNSQISKFNSEIQNLESTISKKQIELNESKELFKQRLVAMYVSGPSSELAVILSANDFADFLSKAELVRTVTEYDTNLMKKITAAMDEIKTSKAKIEENKSVISDAKAKVATKQKELSDQYNEVNTIVSKNQSEINKKQADYAAEEKAAQDLTAKIKAAEDAAKAANNSPGSGSSIVGTGQFIWPVPGYYTISSPYGQRWGRLHGGVDISSSGIYGARIVAADAGSVIVNDYDSGGYGYYVVISHGNGYSTVYGHMKAASSLRVGQSISKGQTVGYVGSTGSSTGPHLHFEIRVNGERKNPMNWF